MVKFRFLQDQAAYGDFYQPIYVRGRLVHRGGRNCADRWALIRPALPRNLQVAIDLGSNAGYFGQRIAEECPAAMVWSMESEPRRAMLQRDVLMENDARNVVLTTRQMDAVQFFRLFRSVNVADVILALSVLEYWSPDEAFAMLQMFAKLAPMLFLEVPRPEEAGAAQHPKGTIRALHPIHKVLGKVYGHVELLGATPAATDPSKTRDLWLAENPTVWRGDLLPYVGGLGGRRHELACNHLKRVWVLDGRDDLTKIGAGLNLWSVLSFDAAYLPFGPDAIDAPYQAILEHYGTISDVHPRNILVTPDGPRPFDFLELYQRPRLYGQDRADYEAGFPAHFADRVGKTKAAIAAGNVEPFRVVDVDPSERHFEEYE